MHDKIQLTVSAALLIFSQIWSSISAGTQTQYTGTKTGMTVDLPVEAWSSMQSQTLFRIVKTGTLYFILTYLNDRPCRMVITVSNMFFVSILGILLKNK